eukprot:CAMPEP_0181516794 /NCGR_PEP_ID=MMETSP1110-20121109/64342_1 /TAXON_ID=174948 /ORGANISM="Symbiodinium sp., Strain CCMP421" /LENGTH=54 /DNA_ID=CAMNT_0023646991 /DNA_START=63 /DNA_END=227 /DNA_ORIENTATION=+
MDDRTGLRAEAESPTCAWNFWSFSPRDGSEAAIGPESAGTKTTGFENMPVSFSM